MQRIPHRPIEMRPADGAKCPLKIDHPGVANAAAVEFRRIFQADKRGKSAVTGSEDADAFWINYPLGDCPFDAIGNIILLFQTPFKVARFAKGFAKTS